MDLKEATIKEMKDELSRREMLEKNQSIKDHVNFINTAYNTGRIESISLTEDNLGTSAYRATFHVHMK
jgi:hypothetical protein